MKVSQLRQIIKEEIQKEAQKATLPPGEDNMPQSVKTALEDGKLEVITSENLKVGDNLVLKRNMMGAKITNIEEGNFFISWNDGGKKKLDKETVESSFLRIVPQEQSQEPLNEQFLRMQKLAGVLTETQYRKKVQMLNEEITVGKVYTASMPTSSDGKERIDIEVKVLGKDRSNEDKFIVTPLEDKDYTNPASGQKNRFEKGKQYGVEAEFLSA